jgi:hypothetical protein
MSQQFMPLLVGTAIAVISSISATTPAHSAPAPKTPEQSAATLGEVITPFCPNNQPFPFPTAQCPTGVNPFPDRQDLDELQKQMNDQIQKNRRSIESDKILVPLIQITF